TGRSGCGSSSCASSGPTRRPRRSDGRTSTRPEGCDDRVDETRARIFDDLRGLIAGELSFEPIRRSSYSRDGSLFEVDPLGVVAPRTHDDLAALVRYAAARGIPIHARGAGTNPFGAAIGRGIVVDFSCHLRRIVAIDEASVTVPPGAVLD